MLIYKIEDFYLQNNNLTNKELTEKANCSERTINYWKNKLNLLTYGISKDPKWDYNKLLNLTEESAYWAGFLLADGCFFQENNERKVGISLSSAVIDEQHIIKFKNWIETSNTLYYSKDNCVSVAVYSKREIPKIMSFWNFSYRKTYVPYEIPSILFNSDYFKYFLIGLIDGDGSIVQTGNTYKISITQHKCQIHFFEEIQKYLMNNNKLYISDRDNTVNLTIQRPEIKNQIKAWYLELKDLPLKRKLDRMI